MHAAIGEGVWDAWLRQALHRKTDWRRHVKLLDEEEDRPGQLLSSWLVRSCKKLLPCMHACEAALLAPNKSGSTCADRCSALLHQAEQGLDDEPEPVEGQRAAGKHADGDATGPSAAAGAPEDASSAAQGQAMSGVQLWLPACFLMPDAWHPVLYQPRALMLPPGWCMHAAEELAKHAKGTGRTAWRQEALQQLQPVHAPEVEGLQGVEGDARTVLDAAAVLGVRHDLIRRAAARWQALMQPEDLPA